MSPSEVIAWLNAHYLPGLISVPEYAERWVALNQALGEVTAREGLSEEEKETICENIKDEAERLFKAYREATPCLPEPNEKDAFFLGSPARLSAYASTATKSCHLCGETRRKRLFFERVPLTPEEEELGATPLMRLVCRSCRDGDGSFLP